MEDIHPVDGAQGALSVGVSVVGGGGVRLDSLATVLPDLADRAPDESTVRKLTRRIGPETVSELTRSLIATATREKRFRPRAVRIDSTVIAADVKYPTDAGLASSGVRVLAREGRKLAALVARPTSRISRVLMTGPLAPFADAYRAELRRRGYAPRTIIGELRQAARFSGWLEADG
jgi:hypothetical protein